MRVLYLDLDCCRSDHLSLNGYHRLTSPTLDAVGAEGVSFRQCFCANSPCLPSRASLMSGRFGINNGVVTHHGPGEVFRKTSYGHGRDPRFLMWPMVLWKAGFHTVSFSCFHHRHNAYWWCDGWAEQHNFLKAGQETADEVNAEALPWFKAHAKEDNWFAHVHYWDIHSHYRLSAADARVFADEPAPDWPDEDTIGRQYETFYGPRSGRDLYTGYEFRSGSADKSPTPVMPDHVSTRAEFKRLIDGYDAAIRYVDRHVAQLLEVLDGAGVLDETAILVSADHGDSFGEHGQYMDHGIANDAVHNIPLIVRWPGLAARGFNDELVYGMDLAATVVDLLGLEVPAGWDARSLAPALRGEAFAGWPYLVFDHGIYTLSRAVRTRDWLMIRMLHPGCYPYDEPVLLHDLRADPHQAANLAEERPEVVADLSVKLQAWKEEQLAKGCAPDPLEEMVSVGPFLYTPPEYMLERLMATGRPHHAEDLKRRLRRFHPGRFE